jgi:hypothetical protein
MVPGLADKSLIANRQPMRRVDCIEVLARVCSLLFANGQRAPKMNSLIRKPLSEIITWHGTYEYVGRWVNPINKSMPTGGE